MYVKAEMTLPTYERNKVSKQGSLTAEMEKSSQELRGCKAPLLSALMSSCAIPFTLTLKN